MPIRISKEPKTFEVEVEGSKFILKELSDTEILRLHTKYAVKGEVPKDQIIEYNVDFLKMSIVGWENVLDTDSEKQTPFDKGLIEQLPGEIQGDLLKAGLDKLNERREQREKETKNSKATSSKKH